ncbi:hypothetical protein N0V94_002176 [Neodidymelliopsis sp. IMI 364377]|nr:hypothetical protein N0V94_002176 [Neodidymelliopsis sp. IMI 364377]
MIAATALLLDVNNHYLQTSERHQPRFKLEGAATDLAVENITSTTSTETETPSCYISDDAQRACTPTYTPNPDYKWGTFYTGEYTPTPQPISSSITTTTAESDYETANEDLEDWEEGPIVQSIEFDARDMYVTPNEIRPVPKRAWNKVRNKKTRQQAK